MEKSLAIDPKALDRLYMDYGNLRQSLKLAKEIIEEHCPHVLTEDDRGIEIEETLSSIEK